MTLPSRAQTAYSKKCPESELGISLVKDACLSSMRQLWWSFYKMMPFDFHFKKLKWYSISSNTVNCVVTIIPGNLLSPWIRMLSPFSSPFPFFTKTIQRKPTILCSHSFFCSHPRGHCFARDLLHMVIGTHTLHSFIHLCIHAHMQTSNIPRKSHTLPKIIVTDTLKADFGKKESNSCL